MPSLLHLALTIPNGLSLTEKIPAGYTTGFLAGAGTQYFTAAWGSVILREMIINGFVLGHFVFRITEPVNLHFSGDEPSGILHYALKENLMFNSLDRGVIIQLQQQEYVLGYHPAVSELLIHFLPGEHQYFQLAFSYNLLVHLFQPGNRISEFFTQLLQTSIPLFHPYPMLISKRVMGLIRKLLDRGSENRILFQNNCALWLITRFVIDTNAAYKKQHWEQKKILKLEELEAFILDHLDTDSKKFITINICAKKTGTTAYGFKQLFRGRYQQSLSQFIRSKRMEKALTLITLSELPAGEVYLQVGYEDFSSFSRAFRLYFGYPPSHYKTVKSTST